MNLMDRFFSKVKKSSGCWEWIGAINSDGYGNFGFNGRIEKAHSKSKLDT